MHDTYAPATSVVVVDSQPIVRDGISQRAISEGLDVRAQVGTRREAESAIAAHRPNLAVVDLMLDLEDGLELVSWVRVHHAATRVLVFSMRDAAVYGERALRAGALGFVSKAEPVPELVRAMHTVAAGRLHMPASLAERLARSVHGRARAQPGVDALSDRELQVFELLGSGRSTQQIADVLGVSMKTIATHRAHIQRKLGIMTLGELVRRAVLWAETRAPAYHGVTT